MVDGNTNLPGKPETMTEPLPLPSRAGLLVQGAALVVIIAGLQHAAPVLVPFLLAVFAAFVAMPPLLWLQNRGLPYWAALTAIILVGLLLTVLLVAVLGASIADFSRSYPVYNQHLHESLVGLQIWLNAHGIPVSEDFFRNATQVFDPGAIMQLAGNLFTSLSNMLTNAFFIFLTTIFILLEVPSFPDKLRQISATAQRTLDSFHVFGQDLLRYLAIKTMVSLITGMAVGIWLAILGVDFALLWGLLAFLFNFVPNIGSIIAAIPAVVLALVQGGLQLAMLTAFGYLTVNIVMGNILEPKVMGHGLGLSVLAVFLSLIFWGWVLGPVGMLLSVPLTMFMKVVLGSREETRWIAILIGPGDEARSEMAK